MEKLDTPGRMQGTAGTKQQQGMTQMLQKVEKLVKLEFAQQEPTRKPQQLEKHGQLWVPKRKDVQSFGEGWVREHPKTFEKFYTAHCCEDDCIPLKYMEGDEKISLRVSDQ